MEAAEENSVYPGDALTLTFLGGYGFIAGGEESNKVVIICLAEELSNSETVSKLVDEYQ